MGYLHTYKDEKNYVYEEQGLVDFQSFYKLNDENFELNSTAVVLIDGSMIVSFLDDDK